MIRSRALTLIAFLAVASWMTGVAIAQHNHGGGMDHQGMGHGDEHAGHAAMAKTGSLKSKVMEMKEGLMVVEGKYQGKIQRLTVSMDRETKMEGQVGTGSEVTIKYRENPGGLLYATSVKGPKAQKGKNRSSVNP